MTAFLATVELGAGKEPARAILTLRNTLGVRCWWLVSAALDAPLAERFEAHLVQRCVFDDDPPSAYLQALGATSGALAFWVDPGATLRLEQLRLRHYGGPLALEAWRVATLEVDGRPAEAWFPQLTCFQGPTTVLRAERRSTQASLDGPVHAVRAAGVERWAQPLGPP